MTSEKKKKTRWETTRKFFNDVHLWAGLVSGVVVIVICFTGTVYVFNTELRELSTPELYHVAGSHTGVPFDVKTVIETVEAKTGGKVMSVKIAADKERLWQFSVRNEVSEQGGKANRNESAEKRESKNQGEERSTSGAGKGTQPEQSRGRARMGTQYAINQYTGEVVGDITNTKTATSEFMRTMFSLHRWLMLDRIEEPIFGELPNRKLGSYISGTATILFTLGVLTGLVIWFPKKIKNWKQGLAIKWDANWKRINHDLHNSLAFYSLIFLFLMGITGPQWSFEWYREGLQKTLGTYKSPDAPKPAAPKSTLPVRLTTITPLTIEDYLRAADNVLPYEGDYTITLPQDSISVVFINKTRTGFFAPAASDKIALDQYTTEVVFLDVFTDKPFNERIAGSIKAIHVGDVYGKLTKIIYFIACLVATTLPVTGTIIWINKLRKKTVKKIRKAVLAET